MSLNEVSDTLKTTRNSGSHRLAVPMCHTNYNQSVNHLQILLLSDRYVYKPQPQNQFVPFQPLHHHVQDQRGELWTCPWQGIPRTRFVNLTGGKVTTTDVTILKWKK